MPGDFNCDVIIKCDIPMCVVAVASLCSGVKSIYVHHITILFLIGGREREWRVAEQKRQRLIR